jgi:hypothetical protein
LLSLPLRCLATAAVAILAFLPSDPSHGPSPGGPVTVSGDTIGKVDIRVRSDSTSSRRGAPPKQPVAADAPQGFEQPCGVPEGSPERYVPTCLAGTGGAPRPAAGGGVVTVALEARDQLVLPVPAPRLRPLLKLGGGRAGGVTGAPIWLWTDSTHWSPGGTPLTRRAQAGSVWAMVSAAAVRMVWLPGDGSAVTCLTPGTPLTDPARGTRGSPDCGHTYRRTSAAQAGGRYRVTVSVTWAVTWVGSDGTHGALAPLVVRAVFGYTVRQARAELVSPG